MYSNYDLEAKHLAFYLVSHYTSELTLKLSVPPLHHCSRHSESELQVVAGLRFTRRWIPLAADLWSSDRRRSIRVAGVSAEPRYSANQCIDSARQAQKTNSSLLTASTFCTVARKWRQRPSA